MISAGSKPAQREFVLQLLRKRGTEGFSSLEALNFAIMRLPNRVCELRKTGSVIDGRPEAGGVMRYFLRSEPKNPRPLLSYAERTWELEAKAAPLFAPLFSEMSA
ncbi:MAG TPA: helix-turn-helix domain-containing protein [Candidatus Dormibacteraeota bacterium]|nr:helix-turn-helix domain-containing protein [Candidatus Dormibacteraeota bacterium]